MATPVTALAKGQPAQSPTVKITIAAGCARMTHTWHHPQAYQLFRQVALVEAVLIHQRVTVDSRS